MGRDKIISNEGERNLHPVADVEDAPKRLMYRYPPSACLYDFQIRI
jgi:hypothetical protein